MEYTKDLILNIRYDESSNTLHLKTSKWTSKLIQKIKKHKLALTISAMFLTICGYGCDVGYEFYAYFS